MSADIQRIRSARFFRELPDLAFDRVMGQVRVTLFDAGQTVVEFPSATGGDYGFVVTGAVFFMSADQRPMGISLKDEFFLTRPFTIQEKSIAKIVAVHPKTLVIFVPKAVIIALSKMSSNYARILDEIYESVFDRTRALLGDETSRLEVQAWIKHGRFSEVNRWIEKLERKRDEKRKERELEEISQKRFRNFWIFGGVAILIVLAEVILRFLNPTQTLIAMVWPGFSALYYKPGFVFHLVLGGAALLLLIVSQSMILVRHGIRHWKWKTNDYLVQQIMVLSGILALLFGILHSSFPIHEIRIETLALLALGAASLTGFVAQFVATQIPRTLKGDRMRLENLSEQREQLRDRLNLVVPDPQIYKTAWGMLEARHPRSVVGHILMAPFLWARSHKVKSFLKDMGVGDESATLAVRYLISEFLIAQRIHFLGAIDRMVTRWMMIQVPIGLAAIGLAVTHAALFFLR